MRLLLALALAAAVTALPAAASTAGDEKGTRSRSGCLLTANPVKIVLDDDTGERVERYRATIVCSSDQPRDERRSLRIATPRPSAPCPMPGLRTGTIYRCTATNPAVCNGESVTRTVTATLHTKRAGRRVVIVSDRAPTAAYACRTPVGS